MADSIDFAGEGLLDGLEGEERESRLALLERLSGDGAELEELRDAVDGGRLPLMELERMLAGRPRYTSEEISELSGVPIDELERQWRSIGLAVPNRDEKVLSREDLDAANRMRSILDAGLAPEQLAELGRTIAVAMSQFAAASRQVVGGTFVGDGGAEDEVSDRVAEGAGGLIPTVGPTLDYVYRRHLREQLRHAAFDEVDVNRVGGGLPDAGMIAVGFADLVGFTKLGEQLPPEELGRVTGRLEEVAREVSHGPVRLVKLIGDAAMLASADTTALLESMLELVDAMAEEEDGFPLVRAGLAYGAAFTRGGDYYGRPVNLASRITEVARPGSVLVAPEVVEHIDEDAYRLSKAGRKNLKGIKGNVEVWRVRRLEGEPGDGKVAAEE